MKKQKFKFKFVPIRRNGFCGMLTILFIAFKLLGIITWSWLWVLSPLWIGAVLAIAILLIVAIIAIVGNN